MATVNPRYESASFVATRFLAPSGADDLVIPSSAYTLDGFREWILSPEAPERGQFTFAGGELMIDISPEAYETHNSIKSEISAVIYQIVKQRKLGRFFSDRFLLSNTIAGISTEPDAIFVSGESRRTGRCSIKRSNRPGVSEELVGSPDWVLEILSRSSMRKDRKLLFDGYFQAGVDEYWLIDALGDDISFQAFIRGNHGFDAVPAINSWLSSKVFGCSFQLTREAAADGLWDYTLHVTESRQASK